MKNTQIKLAVLLMAALTVSCQFNETPDDPYIPQEGDIVFRTTSNVKMTKSSLAEAKTTDGISIDLGTEGDTNFFLEETVTSLDAIEYAPATKGTPAYTENVGKLYADMGVHADAGTFGDVNFELIDTEMMGDGWRYKHRFDETPWPDDSDAQVGFYLHMPATQSGVSGYTYGKSGDKGTISFDYTSPANAQAMQDILFSYRTLSENDYKTIGKSGAPVLFNHALTAVKFRIGNSDEDIAENSIKITEVIFKGLYDTGTCTVTPYNEGDYVDNTTLYSSSIDGVVVWNSSASSTSTSTGYSSGTFGELVEFAASGETGSFDSKGNYPADFATSGTKNLNDADATQTFWFIPQSLSRTTSETPVTITVKYTYGTDSEAKEWVIDFSDIVTERNKDIEWKAGELRTYTLRVAEVNVKIEDEVNIVEQTDDVYEGSTKSNITITNTGNTTAYIRAAIVGQWIREVKDESGNITDSYPVFGFTDKTNELYIVESWYEDQFVNETHNHGVFSGLPGYKENGSRNDYNLNDWQLCDDGYYYYILPVDPKGATKKLFESYTVGTRPNAQSAGVVYPDAQMHFELEIATQAVTAMGSDGLSIGDWKAAWKNATGTQPVEKTN